MERDSSPHEEDLWKQQGERLSRGSGRGREDTSRGSGWGRGDEPNRPPAPPWSAPGVSRGVGNCPGRTSTSPRANTCNAPASPCCCCWCSPTTCNASLNGSSTSTGRTLGNHWEGGEPHQPGALAPVQRWRQLPTPILWRHHPHPA